MKKLRFGSMAVTIVLGVGAFLLAQRFDVIPGPWSKDRPSLLYQMQLDQMESAQDYMSYYRRGVLLERQRQFDQALANLDTAVRLRPTPLSLEVLGVRASDTTVPETRTLNLVVLVHTTRADLLQQMNRPTEALADLDQALAFDNRKMDTFYQRAMLRLMTGRYEDAVADFDVVLNTRKDADWFFGRAVAKYVQRDWIGASRDFEAAARMTPANQKYLIWLAKTYLRAGIVMPPDSFAAIGPNSAARYVIEAFMSDYNPQQFMAGMRAGAAYVDRRQRGIQCETALFMGEWLIMRKKGVGADGMFKEAETSCPPLSVEHTVATAELQRLNRRVQP